MPGVFLAVQRLWRAPTYTDEGIRLPVPCLSSKPARGDQDAEFRRTSAARVEPVKTSSRQSSCQVVRSGVHPTLPIGEPDYNPWTALIAVKPPSDAEARA